MTGVAEVGSVGTVVNGFEDHTHDLLHDFVPHTWNAEFSHFAVWLGNKRLPHRSELKLLGAHALDDFSNSLEGESIQCSSIPACCHVACLRLSPLLAQNVQSLPTPPPY